MSAAIDVVWLSLVVIGAFFFTAGTLGLIRFPDVRSRLHALTKADNLGLGMVFVGVAVPLGDWATAGVMLLAWILALGAASVSAQVLAGVEVRQHAGETDDLDDQEYLDGRRHAADRGRDSPTRGGPQQTGEGPRGGGDPR